MFVGIAAAAMVSALALYAAFVVLANSGFFLRFQIPRRFSLHDILVVITLVAVTTGFVALVCR